MPDLLDRELAGRQELLHELLVAGRGFLEQLGARLGDRRLHVVRDRDLLALLVHALAGEGERLVLDQVDDAVEGLRQADRELHRHRVQAQAVVHRPQRAGEVGVLLVHHVDHEERGLLHLSQHLPHHFGSDLGAGVGAQHQNCRVDHAQAAQDVADEVRVARGVEEIDLVAGPLELGEPEADGDLPR